MIITYADTCQSDIVKVPVSEFNVVSERPIKSDIEYIQFDYAQNVHMLIELAHASDYIKKLEEIFSIKDEEGVITSVVKLSDISRIEEEICRRYDEMLNKQVTKFKDLQDGEKAPILFYIVDYTKESRDKYTNEQLDAYNKLLYRVIRIARAAGVHLIFVSTPYTTPSLINNYIATELRISNIEAKLKAN